MSLFVELKRRNVIKVAVLYLVAAWLILQVTDILIPALTLPESALRLVTMLLILGFPLVLIFSWVFEMTPEGLKREKDIDRSQSITPETGRRINVLIVVLLIAAIGVVVVDRLIPEEAPPMTSTAHEAQPDATPPPATGAASAPANSIAVLPFVNMSGDQENEYFADGLSEEILNSLVGIGDLQVTARTSSFQFKGRNEDLRDVGAMLNVANILEGSVRRSGNRARITAQLIRTQDGYHLWSQNYDRTLEDTFEVQTDIAESVARAMDVVLDEDQRQRMRDSGIRNVDAFVDFQKGRQSFYEAHEGGIDLGLMKESADLFTAAVDKEPGLSDAYHLRSDYYMHAIMESADDDDDLRREYGAAYERDLELAGRYAETPHQRALIEVDATLWSRDWTLLDTQFERALESTGCAEGVWFEVVQTLGDRQEAFRYYRDAIACDPLNWLVYQSASMAAIWAGEPRAALEIVTDGRRVLEDAGLAQDASSLDMPESFALLALGRDEDAQRVAEDSTVDLRDTIFSFVAAAQGRLDDARTYRKKQMASGSSAMNAYNEIALHAIVGDRELANAAAARLDSFDTGSTLLATTVHFCHCGAPFDLGATPNFRARLEEAGVEWPPFAPIRFPAMQSPGE